MLNTDFYKPRIQLVCGSNHKLYLRPSGGRSRDQQSCNVSETEGGLASNGYPQDISAEREQSSQHCCFQHGFCAFSGKLFLNQFFFCLEHNSNYTVLLNVTKVQVSLPKFKMYQKPFPPVDYFIFYFQGWSLTSSADFLNI